MKRVFTQTFGIAGAIIEKDGKILLVQETKKVAKGLWNHPAGWIDVGENPLNAVSREVKEETGYDFSPTHILGVYSLYEKKLKEKFNITPHAIKIIFIGNISKNTTGEIADDVSKAEWFTPEEIYQMDINILRNLDIKKMVKDYFSGKRYPLELLTHTIGE